MGPRIAPATDPGRTDLVRARRQLERVFDAIGDLAAAMDVKTRFKLDLVDAVSTSALGLDLTNTAAFLESVEEINASPNSFSPFGPAWAGASTALLTIGGEYDGSNGTGTLGFEARRGGTHGVNNLRLRVTDPLGGTLTQFNIQRNDPLDQQYSLGNGLFVTLGGGDLVLNDTTSIQVFQNVGAAAIPTNPLGGVRNSNPNFQYYPSPNSLPAIVDGSFDVNGQNVTVSTTDTLNDVIDRINQSTAGVTAQFNATSERVEFTQDTLGEAPTITLANDTSNLLENAKLDTATVVPGIDPETLQAMDVVTAFSSVQTGSFLVNGRVVAVDPASDSLDDVLQQINASSADVTASFDAGTDRVTITSNQPDTRLELDSNGTGLFTALNIDEGRFDPELKESGISRRRSYEIADAAERLSAALNDLFDDDTFNTRDARIADVRNQLSAAVESFLAGGTNPETRYGVGFDRDALSNGRFASIERRAFTENLQLRGDAVKDAFFGVDDDGGLIARLFSATQGALSQLNSQLGATGGRISTFA